MNNFEQFKKDFKRDLLVKVIVSMKRGATSKSQGKMLARYILQILREGRAANAFMRLNKLAENYPGILDIMINRIDEYDTREKKEKIEQIQIFLKTHKRDLSKGGEN